MIDDDLAELASVLAEYQLDNNAHGWFRSPWRDGWNAVELAARAEIQHYDMTSVRLMQIMTKRERSAEVYWWAQDTLRDMTDASLMFRAALRCLQVLVSDSHGGGVVFNDILKDPFLVEGSLCDENRQELILEHRCRDAIGTTAKLQNDLNDRQRRAFTIAWSRGLYTAAYALPPTIKIN